MTTAQQIITRALSEIGVLGAGDTLDAGDAQKAFDALNDLVGTWNSGTLYSYATRDATATIGPGDAYVTVGPGQTIDVPAPARIEQGAFVRVGTYDYPVRVVTRNEYDSILNKNNGGTWPQVAFYDRAGKIRLYPVNGSDAELHIPLNSRLSSFVDLTTQYTLPDGYDRALSLSLAIEVADMFQRPVSQNLALRAANAKRVIKRANVQVPELDTGFGGGLWGMTFGSIDGGGGPQGGIAVGDSDYLIYT